MVIWAALQFALPTVASYADAILERSGVTGPVAHVEAHAGLTCKRAHPADCAFCQVANRGAIASSPACLPQIVVQVFPPFAARTSVPAAVERGRLPRTRAPPAV